MNEHLLAAVVDQLRAANWQRGGAKGARPQPVPRPGVKEKTQGTKVVGRTDGRSPEEVRAYFAQFAPPPLEGEN